MRELPVAGAREFDTLFRAHYPRLVQALTIVCGSTEMAADCVQEAFVRAHQRWGKVGRYEDPVGWVRRVAINRLRDEHRRAGRAERARARLTVEEAVEPHHDPLATVGEAMASLPKQQRVAMALFYVEDLSVAEVATAMGLSEGAVKFHLSRGRDRLRQVLEGDGR